MADFSKFRTAVSGFNRTDVVNYIESASMEHQKALRKLTDERDKLAAENAQLQTQLTGLQARLIQVQADNDALSEQVSTLAQEGSDLADQLKAAEAARAEAARCLHCGHCQSCWQCVASCPGLILKEGEHGPEVAYPDECWHCGCCRIACPTGSISYRFPMTMML